VRFLAASLLSLLLLSPIQSQHSLVLSKKPNAEQVATAEATIKSAQQSPTVLAFGGYAIIDIKLEGKLKAYVVPGSDDCIKTISIPKGTSYSGWLVPAGDTQFRWVTIEPNKDIDRLLVVGTANGSATVIWHAVVNGESEIVAAFKFDVGQPRPPPDPIDPPKPVDPPITNYTGLRVILIREQSAKLTREQANIFGSAKISDYLNKKCTKDEKGRPAWRSWDKDVKMSELETPSWQALWAEVKPKLGALPQIAIITDQKGETFQLPETEQKTLELLQKYGGK